MKAVIMNRPGDIEVLELADRREPVASPDEVVVEVAAAGVNFMDTGVRRGDFWGDMPDPKILGVEGAGRVLTVGSGVNDFRPGQRVAWVYAPGSYAERLAIPAASLVRIPDEIDDRTAASVMMQGLTASHFATDFYPVQPGDVALVHAAAGGVGLLLTLGGRTPIELVDLPRSIKIGYATFMDHIHTSELLRSRSKQLFDWIIAGKLKVKVGAVYRLAETAQAHADMESRGTTGKLLLIP